MEYCVGRFLLENSLSQPNHTEWSGGGMCPRGICLTPGLASRTALRAAGQVAPPTRCSLRCVPHVYPFRSVLQCCVGAELICTLNHKQYG